ncbi:MAG: ATP-binding protein [Gemmatimonadetes bacterium]|nr:ATP-binding protein [Gemmatimonadota bacterium]
MTTPLGDRPDSPPGRPLLLIVDDEPINVQLMVMALKDQYALLTARNGTDALRLMKEHLPDLVRNAEFERLHALLRQAEKLESVGRLAGGVAHDYNNTLAVIIGRVELGLLLTDVPAELREDLMAVHKAATHSAEITQQLLTFARKQFIQPKTLDLNATVEHSLKMLQRLIGERVQFAVHPAADLWPVRMDPTQVEQMLTTLCLNARDAITSTGTVVVTTANRVIDARQCETLPEATPGAYVQLSVTDSGRGMSPGALSHVFEPFFTPKGVGEGSSLGLASVHGAVRQNGGFIVASSAEGAGATFDIYLPRSQESAAESRMSEPVAPTR